jgi:hypothetical protein
MNLLITPPEGSFGEPLIDEHGQYVRALVSDPGVENSTFAISRITPGGPNYILAIFGKPLAVAVE